MAKIKTGFSEYLNSDLAAFVNGVITALTGNINFPLTQSMLAGLGESLDHFKTAMANAKNSDKALIGLRDTARMQLVLQLTSVAGSVTFEGGGNRDKLLSSGFELYKTRDGQPILLGPIKRFRLVDSDISGGIKAMCDGAIARRSYMYQITPDPLTSESVWQSFPATSKEYTFANLPSCKRFWCRIVAIGTKGQVSISDPLSRVTQ